MSYLNPKTICPNCGFESNEAMGNFCFHCGHEISQRHLFNISVLLKIGALLVLVLVAYLVFASGASPIEIRVFTFSNSSYSYKIATYNQSEVQFKDLLPDISGWKKIAVPLPPSQYSKLLKIENTTTFLYYSLNKSPIFGEMDIYGYSSGHHDVYICFKNMKYDISDKMSLHLIDRKVTMFRAQKGNRTLWGLY